MQAETRAGGGASPTDGALLEGLGEASGAVDDGCGLGRVRSLPATLAGEAALKPDFLELIQRGPSLQRQSSAFGVARVEPAPPPDCDRLERQRSAGLRPVQSESAAARVG